MGKPCPPPRKCVQSSVRLDVPSQEVHDATGRRDTLGERGKEALGRDVGRSRARRDGDDHPARARVGNDRGQTAAVRVAGAQEELEELVEVYEMLSDPEVKEALEAAEAQIERGEGLSFEEAFGEKP